MRQQNADAITFSYDTIRFAESSYIEAEVAPASKPETPTETIDLSAMFADDVTSSGSFDLRRSRLNSFEKLLQAIPIPTLLVDKSCTIVFANHAAKRANGAAAAIGGHSFSVLFPNRSDGEQAEKFIEKVFQERIPLVVEAMVGKDQNRMLGRIHLRSVRIQKMRLVLVIIEDITPPQQLPKGPRGLV